MHSHVFAVQQLDRLAAEAYKALELLLSNAIGTVVVQFDGVGDGHRCVELKFA